MAGRKNCISCLEKTRPVARVAVRRPWRESSDAGLCIQCGANPPKPGRMRCKTCSDLNAAADRRRYMERRAAGICCNCGKAKAGPKITCCTPCAEARRVKRPEGVAS